MSVLPEKLVHMMFEEDRRPVPRAYTALPDSPDHAEPTMDLKRAIRWCIEQAGGEVRRIAINTGRRSDLEDVPLLKELVKSGAGLYPSSRGKLPALPPGPTLLYQPLPETLWQIEDWRGPSAIAAVGITGPTHFEESFIPGNYVGAQPWISAYKPTHLGGPIIEPKTPIVSDPVVWEALKSFTDSINSTTGLSHVSDRSQVTEGLIKLRLAGHTYDADDLLSGALALNWRGSAALALHDLAQEIISGKRKQYRPSLKDNIVEIWELRSAERHGAERTGD